MSVRATYSYAVLNVSLEAYLEIRVKLKAAGYSDQFYDSEYGEVIDMRGIALQSANETKSQPVGKPRRAPKTKEKR